MMWIEYHPDPHPLSWQIAAQETKDALRRAQVAGAHLRIVLTPEHMQKHGFVRCPEWERHAHETVLRDGATESIIKPMGK